MTPDASVRAKIRAQSWSSREDPAADASACVHAHRRGCSDDVKQDGTKSIWVTCERRYNDGDRWSEGHDTNTHRRDQIKGWRLKAQPQPGPDLHPWDSGSVPISTCSWEIFPLLLLLLEESLFFISGPVSPTGIIKFRATSTPTLAFFPPPLPHLMRSPNSPWSFAPQRSRSLPAPPLWRKHFLLGERKLFQLSRFKSD